MLQLPYDLQTSIAMELDALDLYHLQLTCKDAFHMVEGSTAVWRGCLHRQCVTDGLLWASFKHLTTVSELKAACTWAPCFQKRVRDRLRDSTVGPWLSNPTTLPTSNSDDTDAVPAISYASIVPGGRYMITGHSNELILWDLMVIPGSHAEPKDEIHRGGIVLRHRLNLNKPVRFFEDSEFQVEVISTTKVQVLVHEGFDDVPWESLTDDIKHYERTQTECMYSRFHLVEMTIPFEGPPLVSATGTIALLHNPHPVNRCNSMPIIHSNGRVIFHFARTTILWDYIEGTCATARLSYEDEVLEVIQFGDRLYYIVENGVKHLSIPGVLLDSVSSLGVLTSFCTRTYLTYSVSEEVCPQDYSTWWAAKVRDVLACSSPVFEAVSLDTDSRDLLVKRYKLVVPPGSICCRVQETNRFYIPQFAEHTAMCGVERVGEAQVTVWVDQCEGYDDVKLSMHTGTSSVYPSSIDGDPPATDIGPMLCLITSRPGNRLEGIWHSPLSGKAIILWNRDDEDGVLEIYDML